jgi:hypothetical protein
VVADHGETVTVQFVSPGGVEAVRTLPKSILAHPDGSPLGGGGPEPLDENGWPLLRLDPIPEVLPFPTSVLPDPVARLVSEGAEAIGCPEDFLGLSALVVAAGAIGQSANLEMKEGYLITPALYAGCVGPPSDGKTSAIKIVAAPLRRIDEELAGEYAETLAKWEEEAAAAKQAWDRCKNPRPRPRRIDVDDVTMEVLPLILEADPRGLVMVRDELAALGHLNP